MFTSSSAVVTYDSFRYCDVYGKDSYINRVIIHDKLLMCCNAQLVSGEGVGKFVKFWGSISEEKCLVLRAELQVSTCSGSEYWVLSHWAHFTMCRFICVYLCVFVSYCICIIVSTVGWT